MKITSLRVNSEVIFSGQKFNILSINPPEITLIRTDGKVDPIKINFFELIANPSFKPSKHLMNEINRSGEVYFSLLDNLSEKKREKVSKRLVIIRPILVLEKVKQGDWVSHVEFFENYKHLIKSEENIENLTQDKLLDRLSKNYGQSKRTIQRYLSRYRSMELSNPNKGEEGLIPREGDGYRYRKDNKVIPICHPKRPDFVLHTLNTRLSEEYIPIIKRLIENEFLNIHRKSKKKIFELINIDCIKENLDSPKEITIYKMLERIPRQIIDRYRYGGKTSEKYLDISRGYSNEEALFPLHVVEIDHTKLDIDVLDETTGCVVGRPWITLGIDVYSRMVWCFYISFEPPSANKVRKAIEHGVLFKNTKEKYGTNKEWEMFGIPKNIVLDNGTEFSNVETKRMINEVLKSNVRYRPVGTPRYGGTIERLFGTLNTKLIHQLQGTRKSNVNDLGEYDAEKNALLTLEDLKEILTKFITDIYHYEVHRGLPLDSNCPIVRYYEGLKICGFPDFIEEDEIENFKLDLLPKLLKPYTRDGIRINNRFYRSSELSVLINKREVKYVVKYDVDDISYVYLKLPDSSEYVKVLASYPSWETLLGINEYTYKLLIKQLRDEGKAKRNKIVSEQELLHAKAQLQKDIEQKYKKGRQIRQQTARMNLDVDIVVSVSKAKKTESLSYEQILEKARRAYKKIE